MHFPVVVYWCQYKLPVCQLNKVFIREQICCQNCKTQLSKQQGILSSSLLIPTWLLMRQRQFVCLHRGLEMWTLRKTYINCTAYLLYSVSESCFTLNWVENSSSNPSASRREMKKVPPFFLESLLSKVIWLIMPPNTTQDPTKKWSRIDAAG